MDAILWVLGEQSTKTLRSEKMEDVIFNGTEVRKPLGMAEVSLVISGLDQVKVKGRTGLPSQLAEYQDLMITRRLYRNGDSEYLINKTSVPLKGHSQHSAGYQGRDQRTYGHCPGTDRPDSERVARRTGEN